MNVAMDLDIADCGGDFMAFTGRRLAAERVSSFLAGQARKGLDREVPRT